MKEPKCAKCKAKPCREGITDTSKLPLFCPIRTSPDLVRETKNAYQKKTVSSFYRMAALTEKEAYDPQAARNHGRLVPTRPRIKEIAAFAAMVKAEKIGLAFCSGLSDEASRADAILEKHGLEVISVACSCGALDKTEAGIPEEDKITSPGTFETACNPLLQASLLNRAGTAFNVIIGLCVGHDMLFTSHSKAPVTTLIVKDRLTGHNPFVSLYTRYHRHLVE